MNNIQLLTANLKKRNLAPSNIEIAKWNEWTMVSCYNEEDKLEISERVSMGIDKSAETALLKSLTEHCERFLMQQSEDPISKLTVRSDGFAALPAHYEFAEKRVRQNALNEACERFIWSTWWDCDQIRSTTEEFLVPAISQLIEEFSLKSLRRVTVQCINSEVQLTILMAKIEGAGFVTGGAAGVSSDDENTTNRAFGELLRHLIVVKKMMTLKIVPISFYEKRLLGFGSGVWNHIVEKRLNTSGTQKIKLPRLEVDRLVKHNHEDVILLHRCLFENQPAFMGGSLERLCI